MFDSHCESDGIEMKLLGGEMGSGPGTESMLTIHTNVLITPPLTALTVTGKDPCGTPSVVEILSGVGSGAQALVGPQHVASRSGNDAVAPSGKPETLKST
jgi:hypothetical protein